MEQLGPTGRIVIKFDIWVFSKTCQDNWSLIRMSHEWRVLYMKTNLHLWSYLPEFFLEWAIFQRKVVQKIKTHICIQKSLRKSCPLWQNVEKYVTARQTAHQNILLHAGWIMQECRHTFRICFSRQQWLRERASMLPYTYIASLVYSKILV